MRRSLILLVLIVFLSCCGMATLCARAQETKIPPPTANKPQETKTPPINPGSVANPTAEMVAEAVIFTNGGRAGLNQVRRNGIENGRVSKILDDGRTEDDRYELKFIRGENSTKDKVRIDHKTPQLDYSLVSSGGKVFGIVNGSSFTPRADASASFVADRVHSIDALLRYKENDSKLTLVRKDKQKGVEFFVVDLTNKDNQRTRYYVSTKTGHVLRLEYEETPPGAVVPTKYEKHFHDYRYAQGAWIPFRTVMIQDGKQVLETRILTVTYGVKMEDALFQNPDQVSAANP